MKKYKKKLVLKPEVKRFFNRILLSVLVFLIGMILVKQNNTYKNLIIENVYDKSFKFTKVKNFYKKYFGNILSIEELIDDEEAVFSEKLNYKKDSVYKNGVKLTVSNNYMVPVLEDGIVIFIGEKEGYGNTVIVEQIDGVDVYYSNINFNDIKIYDYVEKGKLLGEVNDNTLYLVFQKDGKFLDYKDYL